MFLYNTLIFYMTDYIIFVEHSYFFKISFISVAKNLFLKTSLFVLFNLDIFVYLY